MTTLQPQLHWRRKPVSAEQDVDKSLPCGSGKKYKQCHGRLQ
ncbi:SEC-C metal-binding domain-containing protein [Escherichia coli]